jgi:hypothetical protein
LVDTGHAIERPVAGIRFYHPVNPFQLLGHTGNQFFREAPRLRSNILALIPV